MVYIQQYMSGLELHTAPSFSQSFTMPNNCMSPLGSHSVDPANRAEPFMFAGQENPQWTWGHSETWHHKSKNQITSGRDFRGGRIRLTSAQLSLTTWNQIININSQPTATSIFGLFFSFSCDPWCCIFSFAHGVISQQLQDLISPP